MPHKNLLSADNALLLIVDVQERFRDHIYDFNVMIDNIGKLIEASQILNLPVLVSEQYPIGLGKLVTELASKLGIHQLFEKTEFSCCENQEFLGALARHGRTQVMISGIEAHVCVSQTVHALLSHGYQAHLIKDAISSRSPMNREIGFEKMMIAGAIPSSVEMALLELVVDSKASPFKHIQRLIK